MLQHPGSVDLTGCQGASGCASGTEMQLSLLQTQLVYYAEFLIAFLKPESSMGDDTDIPERKGGGGGIASLPVMKQIVPPC